MKLVAVLCADTASELLRSEFMFVLLSLAVLGIAPAPFLCHQSYSINYFCFFFFKDDANHDPQWSEAQIVAAKFNLNGLLIGQDEVDIMRRMSLVVFEVLEKAWAARGCALIDMKIEFGVNTQGLC